MSKIDEQAILKHYQSGLSINKIAKLGLASTPTISKILKQNNIAIRKDNGSSLSLPKNQINQLYNKGQSIYELARKFNCSDETIRKLINKPRNHSQANYNRSKDVNKKISKSCKQKWQDPEYVAKVKSGTSTSKYKDQLKKHGKKMFPKALGKWLKTKQASDFLSKNAKELWQDPEYRKKQTPHYQWRTKLATKASLEKLSHPKAWGEWIEKIKRNNIINRANQPRISIQQRQLYYLLDRAGIKYHEESEETSISKFYIVDCIIPKQGNMIKDAIIEVQGEYWHSLDNVIVKDTQKKTFIEKHTNYNLLYLNELDFKCFDTIKRKLYLIGINISSIQCTVKDLNIKQINENDAKLFFETFHYSSTIRKGAITFGAYLNDKLTAAISYTPPIRLQVARNLNKQMKEIREISRLAIATDLKCKNTASWFISKTIKLLQPEITTIISYSDSTYGHTGMIYKASNFRCDRIIENNFHYKDEYEDIYHKKTIWDRSKKMKMTIEEYAEKHGLTKIISKPKKRWVYYKS